MPVQHHPLDFLRVPQTQHLLNRTPAIFLLWFLGQKSESHFLKTFTQLFISIFVKKIHVKILKNFSECKVKNIASHPRSLSHSPEVITQYFFYFLSFQQISIILISSPPTFFYKNGNTIDSFLYSFLSVFLYQYSLWL